MVINRKLSDYLHNYFKYRVMNVNAKELNYKLMNEK